MYQLFRKQVSSELRARFYISPSTGHRYLHSSKQSDGSLACWVGKLNSEFGASSWVMQEIRNKIITIITQWHQKFWKFQDFSTFSRMFGEIPKKSHQNLCKIRWTLSKNEDSCSTSNKNRKTFDEFLRMFWVWSGAKVCKSCRSRKML